MKQKLPTIKDVAELTNVRIFADLVEELVSAPFGQERLGCFHGFSGFGKTVATEVAELAFDAICVEMPENITKRGLMARLCQRLGVSDKGSVDAMMQRVCEVLKRTDQPIIIDDAQYLMRTKDMIGLVRDIYNGANGLTPVILVGEEDLPRKLTMVENVHNRVSVWAAAQPCDIDDAWRLTGIYAPGVEIEEHLLSDIVVASSGGVRRICHNLRNAHKLARVQGLDRVTREAWGNRSFFDGSIPQSRDLSSIRPKVRLVNTPAKRKAV